MPKYTLGGDPPQSRSEQTLMGQNPGPAQSRLEELLKNGSGSATPEQIAAAVAAYLDEHPIDAPFAIPVTYNGSTQTYTTTASAANIVSHFDNLVMTQGPATWIPVHKVLNESTATIRFQSVGSNGLNDAVTFFIVTANSQTGTVTIEFKAGILAPEVGEFDNGKFLRVVSGAWAAQAVPSAESNSFGGGS